MTVSMAYDREIALKYIQYLLDQQLPDDALARQQFCDQTGIHPKLLLHNPHLSAVAALFRDQSNFERLRNMTLYEWALYHQYYVHQAFRYGDPDMQQKWLGHELLKSPFDCWIYQELIYKVRPDFVIELGVMFGGASRFYADVMELIGHGRVLGVDISLSRVKRPLHPRVEYIEGDSVSNEVFEEVKKRVNGGSVLVVADSDHEKSHVLKELRLYSQLVPVGSYYVVEDALNDPMKWQPVPNEGPQAAVREFLQENTAFIPDVRYAERYILSSNPWGYLLRIK